MTTDHRPGTMGGENVAKRGWRFKHKHWLDVSKAPEKIALTFEVTRVAQGVGYYRPVYDEGLPSERLGSASFEPLEKFNQTYCGGAQ